MGIRLHMRIEILTVVLILLPITSIACEREDSECSSFTSWYDVNWLELAVEYSDEQGEARWIFEIHKDQNDIVIEKNEKYDGKHIEGKLIIVSGRMMLAKGLDLKEGYEIDAADGPGLMMQLLLNMLDHITPDGPQVITADYSVNHIEHEKSIKVSTSSASGEFGVPWTAKGKLNKENNNIISFKINFESSISSEHKFTITMEGTWKSLELEPLSDMMSLDGWKLYSIGPYSKKFESGTIFDYGAQNVISGAVTLGDLREEISSDKHAPNNAPQSTQ